MSDDSRQPEFDDELLSAYLDEELAPDERALVEQRLAADPSARQMLDELRHAAQSVRDLPREALGSDVRGAVVRRAVEAKRSGADAPPDRAASPPPAFTVGRTRRGWFWASLAVAAALLIMFVERGEVGREEEVSVAARRREPASITTAPESGRPGRSQPALRVPSESATAVARDSSGTAPGELSVGREVEAIGGRADAVAGIAAEVDGEPLVVVHVLARPEALRNRAFDRLLVSNGISVEPDEPAEEASDGADRFRSLGASTRTAGPAAAGEAGVEAGLYLVEAPPMQIFSCALDLNRDHENFVSIAVDDEALLESAPAPKAAPVKKLASDLEKYSRGVVPREQKELLARNKAYYYQQTPVGKVAGGASGAKLKQSAPEQMEGRLSANEKLAYQGRAQRVIISKDESGEMIQLHEMGAHLKTLADPVDESLQVLFVLTPSDPPAASPTAAPAAAASPADENAAE